MAPLCRLAGLIQRYLDLRGACGRLRSVEHLHRKVVGPLHASAGATGRPSLLRRSALGPTLLFQRIGFQNEVRRAVNFGLLCAPDERRARRG